ncbi:MAG TPA: Crp/Fnr family transcriptional regulator [Candidatus Saccharimonadales bacterium]|nr:Crp/Fnr family transcriptional regulator [Candidatus Saccharimonadales bacterium]
MKSIIKELYKGLRTYESQKGQILAGNNEEPAGVYLIRRGYVKTYDITFQGESQIIAISGPGEIFPLYWALDKEYRQLFYQAMTPIEFSVLSKPEFKDRYENDSELQKEIIELLLRAYKFSQQRIQNLEYKSPRERLAYRLLFLGKYFGHVRRDQLVIDMPLTYQDLADSLNITRDTANRASLELMKQGLIERLDHKVVIKDVDGMKEIIGTDLA